MRIRPGRTRSILAGLMALVVMVVGLWMLTSFGGFGGLGGPPFPFLALWVIIGLGGAAAAFYNAFSRRGLSLYEVDLDDKPEGYCPQCGKSLGSEDQFCRHCGASLQ